jgi:hypothetical protein
MPSYINVTIIWDSRGESMSFYSISSWEMKDIVENYNQVQAHLLYYVHPHLLKEWVWDIFCKEPYELTIDSIMF